MLINKQPTKSELEQRLEQMQQEINTLFARAKTPTRKPLKTSEVFRSTVFSTVDENIYVTYEQLSEIWQRYGIKIPSFKNLESKLKQANKVIEKLGQVNMEMATKMTIILVPPTRLLPFPVPANIRKLQDFDEDILSKEMSAANAGKDSTWRVFVVYGGKTGIYTGTPEDVLDEKQYMIAGMDMSQLGLAEYVALTLQAPHPLDENTWTILYRGRDNKKNSPFIPCASFMYKQYRFDQEEITSVFGTDRFRPALEVK